MAYIQTIGPEEAGEELRQAYEKIVGSRGKLAEVHKIQSLNPSALLAHMELYKAVMFERSPLKRYQREMIAVIVSAANNCAYCVAHHKEALAFYWKDPERLEQLLQAPEKAGLSDTELALCWFAEALTLNPSEVGKTEIEHLRNLGLDDRTILDATQVIAYFNFVNRMVLGLGVPLSEDETKGYQY